MKILSSFPFSIKPVRSLLFASVLRKLISPYFEESGTRNFCGGAMRCGRNVELWLAVDSDWDSHACPRRCCRRLLKREVLISDFYELESAFDSIIDIKYAVVRVQIAQYFTQRRLSVNEPLHYRKKLL